MSVEAVGKKNCLSKPFTSEQLAYLRQRTIETTPRGSACHSWKGGVTPENVRIRKTPEYVDWRNAVFTRDHYSCQGCGDDRGGNLQAHHLLSFADYPEHRVDVENGITVCRDCHEAIHTGRKDT